MNPKDTMMNPLLKTLALSLMFGSSLLMAENSLTLQRTGQEGCRINASIEDAVSGLQFTLVGSHGMTITAVQAGDGLRDGRFMCVWNNIDDHTLRVIVVSNSMVDVISGSLEILRVSISGTSTDFEAMVHIDGAVLSDSKGKGLAVTLRGLTWTETFAGNAPAAQMGNYPNPFNPSTMISYTLNQAGNVRLTVHDILGREVVELANSTMDAGQHTTLWVADNRTISSGVYFARLEVGNQVLVHRMMIAH